MNVISNTRVSTVTEVSTTITQYDFLATPKMSSYLVAFIVSPYVATTSSSYPNFAVYSRPAAKVNGATALSMEFGPKMLEALGLYLQRLYGSLGNDKMDMAAIPDFSAGGKLALRSPFSGDFLINL